MGQAKGGRIIAGAAGIMILVFGSLMLGDNLTIKTFGFGLGFAVLVDAFLIRSTIVPALMHLTGPVNWAMPSPLQRVLPNLSIDSEDGAAPAQDPAPVGVAAAAGQPPSAS